MNKTRSLQDYSAGDAAVEGLLNGILAGIVMAVVVVGIEAVAGASPLAVLGYFAVSNDASPFLGLFTHIAVSSIYGVLFGIVARGIATMPIARQLKTRRSIALWLGIGAVYGLLILGIAEGVVLPRTASPLRDLPVWAFAVAHLFYGVTLAWLTQRNK